jgi:hypothetical protein
MISEEGAPKIFVKESIRLSAFTTESQRSQRKDFFVCPEN